MSCWLRNALYKVLKLRLVWRPFELAVTTAFFESWAVLFLRFGQDKFVQNTYLHLSKSAIILPKCRQNAALILNNLAQLSTKYSLIIPEFSQWNKNYLKN